MATNVSSSDGETVAVKQLDERKFQREQYDTILSEFNTLHKIIHPNVVAYKQLLIDGDTIYVVTEYVENGIYL